ncbi:MAG: outer membrane beta-barrel protein [bacterium]|nr:outer membrane beta-barrel protein [bacterium]
MKRIFIVCLLCLICSSSAFGQIEEYIGEFTFKPEFFITVGPAFPMKDVNFRDNWNAGVSFGGGVGFQLTRLFTLVGSFDYTSFPFDEERFKRLHLNEILVQGPSTKVMTFDARLKFFFPSDDTRLSPYITGGGGFFKQTSDEVIFLVTGIDSEIKTDPIDESVMCFIGGAGLEFEYNEKVYFFLEGLFVTGFTELNSVQIVQVKLGLKYLRNN